MATAHPTRLLGPGMRRALGGVPTRVTSNRVTCLFRRCTASPTKEASRSSCIHSCHPSRVGVLVRPGCGHLARPFSSSAAGRPPDEPPGSKPSNAGQSDGHPESSAEETLNAQQQHGTGHPARTVSSSSEPSNLETVLEAQQTVAPADDDEDDVGDDEFDQDDDDNDEPTLLAPAEDSPPQAEPHLVRGPAPRRPLPEPINREARPGRITVEDYSQSDRQAQPLPGYKPEYPFHTVVHHHHVPFTKFPVLNPFNENLRPKFAVIKLASRQYKVTLDDVVVVDKIEGYDINEEVVNTEVLLWANREKTIIGRPLVRGASVTFVVEEHTKDAKMIIYKRRRRKNSARKRGFRRQLTLMRVVDICP